MKPYYQDRFCEIYHGDCREILPSLGQFDLLLTDPPYGIGKDGQLESSGKHGGRKAYDFMGWDSKRPDLETFSLIYSVCEKHIIWGGNYFADLLPPCGGGWLVWDKGQRINQSDGELAYTSMAKALRIFSLNRVALMTDGAVHPTQKPVALWNWCIAQSGEVKTILDPFAGSGTSGESAVRLGLHATMIEREESYCEIAAMRMSMLQNYHRQEELISSS